MGLHEWKLSVRGERRQPSFIRQLVKYLRLPGIVSLGGGLPHPNLHPLQEIKLSLAGPSEVSIPNSSVQSATAYVPTLGFEPLREWIREYMRRNHEYPHGVGDWQLIIGNGSQDLLQRLFDLILDPEDSLLVEEYTYSGALAAVWPVGCELVPMPMNDFGLDVTALESLLAHWPASKRLPKAIYIVPTAQNPTGTSLSTSKKRRIYELACQYNLVILEDDPYWNLNFPASDNEAPEEIRQSFWTMDVEQRVIRFESLSKITAVGYRVGWACGPHKIIEKLAFDLEAGAQSGSGIAQLLVHEMVKPMLNPDSSTGWDLHVSNIQNTYLSRWNVLSKALEAHLTGLADWKAPTGGMFAWVRLHNVPDSQNFVRLLAEDYLVLTVPGAAFACARDAKSPYIRISYSFCDIEFIEPAIAKLSKALQEYVALHSKASPMIQVSTE